MATDEPLSQGRLTMLFGAASGSSISLSEMPDRIPPPYPVVSFMVTGIEELVEALKARARASLG
ncbi:hypothetical protein [Pseudarthrobacter sp. S9]|uniref:hypothetical protein n=1 Tax=Pseudarthrobacter sp. S9 TaxID=3418421 RepID=UPI003D028D2E